MRLTEKPESIAKVIKTPSGLADVKDVASPQQFAQIERELLEHMKSLNEERAAKFYREMRPSLTPDARAIAEEIIASKAPPASPTRKVAQRNKIQEMVLDDVSRATVTGQRPEKVLDLWKTKEGQQLIKHALEDNPNKKEILKYLTDQSFNDFHASIVSADGVIDFKKMNELLRDPATAENIRMVAGEEGLSFLKQLEQLTERFNRNKNFLEGKLDKGSRREREKIGNEIEKLGKERFKKGKEKRANVTKEEQLAEEAKEKAGLIYKFDDLLNSYGVKAKGLLTALGIINIGLVPGLALAGGWEAFFRLSKNKNVRELFKKAAGPRKDPVATIRAIDAFMKAEDGKD
jgi:vacuolar-type H+-ATPase subunit H